MKPTSSKKEKCTSPRRNVQPVGSWKDPSLRIPTLVTRAPALHPGDMRIATGVKVPESSPLRHLSNCIVFSQQGTRELPSQLSGGDLNGDRFHILYDPRLALLKVEHAADYTPVTPHDLGRPVETKDRADFFINHMKIDNLGQISNKHKIRADKFERETKHSDCKDLARHASKAVDFSKSGVPVSCR